MNALPPRSGVSAAKAAADGVKRSSAATLY